jgi:hypothetical protein
MLHAEFLEHKSAGVHFTQPFGVANRLLRADGSNVVDESSLLAAPAEDMPANGTKQM